MKRLFESSKFWLAVIGATVAVAVQYFFDDTTFSMYVSGLFGLGILGNAAEDMIVKSKKQEP